MNAQIYPEDLVFVSSSGTSHVVSQIVSAFLTCNHVCCDSVGSWEGSEIHHGLWALSQSVPRSGYAASGLDSTAAIAGKGPLFVDVGANVGWFTLSMAARGYETVAFEGEGTR